MVDPVSLGIAIASLTFTLVSTAFAIAARPKGKDPVRDDFSFQTSTYGKRIPMRLGKVQAAGNIIDAVKWQRPGLKNGNFQKGGHPFIYFDSSSEGTVYQEDRDFQGGPDDVWYKVWILISLGQNEIKDIVRVKLNDDIVYDITAEATEEMKIASKRWAEEEIIRHSHLITDENGNQPFPNFLKGHMVKYLGAETQEKDPVLKAFHGDANTPAYRGQAGVMLRSLSLKPYLNQMPTIYVTTITDASTTTNQWTELTITAEDNTVGLWPARSRAEAVSFNDRIYLIAGNDGTNNVQDIWSSTDGLVWRKESPVTDIVTGATTDSGNRIHHGVSVFEDSILIMGGTHDNGTIAHSRVYTPGGSIQLGQTSRDSIPQFLTEASLVTIPTPESQTSPELVLLVGGTDENGKYHEELHRHRRQFGIESGLFATKIWQKVFDVSGLGFIKNPHLVYFSLTEKVYSVGGITFTDEDGNGASNSLACYELSEQENWHSFPGITQFSQLTSDITNGASGTDIRVVGLVEWNSKLIAFVSGITGGRLVTFESTDGTNWSEIIFEFEGSDHLEDMDDDPAIVNHEGAIYVIGGSRSSTPLQKVYKVSDEITTETTTTIEDTITTIATQGSLSNSDIDASDMSGDTLEGYLITERESIRDSLGQLAMTYFFDVIRDGTGIKAVKRGAAGSQVTIQEDELGIEGLVIDPRTNHNKLPLQIDVLAPDPDNDYEDIQSSSDRTTTNAQKMETIETNVIMSANKRKQVANVNLDERWASAKKYKFSLPFNRINLRPADVIQITSQGETHTMRINRREIPPDNRIKYQASSEVLAIYSKTYNTSIAEGTGASGVPRLIPASQAVPVDSAIFTEHDDWGFYLGAFPQGGLITSWNGAKAFMWDDSIEDWKVIADINGFVIKGEVEGVALSDGAIGFWDDNPTSFNVTLKHPGMSLENATKNQVQSGRNLALVGSEIMGFTNVTDNGDRTWTISGSFLRGLFGTEPEVDQHIEGEQFIILDTNSLIRVPLPKENWNEVIAYKVVSQGRSIEDAVQFTFVNTAEGKRLAAPSVSAEKKNDGSWKFEWSPVGIGQLGWDQTFEYPEKMLFEMEFVRESDDEVLHTEEIAVVDLPSNKFPYFYLRVNDYFETNEDGEDVLREGQETIYGGEVNRVKINLYQVNEYGRGRKTEKIFES